MSKTTQEMKDFVRSHGNVDEGDLVDSLSSPHFVDSRQASIPGNFPIKAFPLISFRFCSHAELASALSGQTLVMPEYSQ